MEFVENLGEKAPHHSLIMALVFIKKDSAGFFDKISSQNHGSITTLQMGER